MLSYLFYMPHTPLIHLLTPLHTPLVTLPNIHSHRFSHSSHLLLPLLFYRTYQRTIQYEEDIGSSLGVGHPHSRSREFINLPGDPIITVVVHEVSLSLEELLVVPHIIFVVYEQVITHPLTLSIRAGNNTPSHPLNTII